MTDKKRIDMRPSVLFVGAISGPTTGAIIASKTLIESEFSKVFNLLVINSIFITKLEDMGQLSIRKIWLAINYLARFFLLFLTRRIDAVILTPASKGYALYKDCVFIFVASFLFHRKPILWIHGNSVLNYNQLHWLTKQLISRSFRQANCFVVTSEFLKNRCACWAPPQRIHIIPHGILEALQYSSKAKATSSYYVLNVLYFANLIREKGWIVTLEAAAEILKVRKDFRFVFCGTWWPSADEGIARDLLLQMGIQEWVEFRGPTFGEDKKRAFTEADIFVFPTFFPIEAFPIVTLEAMEAGLPIITTARAGIPEIVKDGVNGYLIPEKDSHALAERLLYLADNSSVRYEMGRQNREKFLEEFTVDLYAERWIRLVNETINER
jgi:glycosyltransferase involved in cell wall biosynthesis